MTPWVVATVALVANRVSLRAGLMTATLSALACHALSPEGFFCVVTLLKSTPAYLAMLIVPFIVAPRRSVPTDIADLPSPDITLPFTATSEENGGLHGAGRIWWKVQPTGDWCKDVEIGEAYAMVYLTAIRFGKPRPMLIWIIADMIATGRFTGIEAGFLGKMAEAANWWKRPLGRSLR